MNPANLHVDPDHPIGPNAARDALTALCHRAQQISGLLEVAGIQLRHYQVQLNAVISVLAPEGIVNPDQKTSIDIALDSADFDLTTQLIMDLQAADQDLSVDDCLNKIFTAGLVNTGLRHLYPRKDQHHE